MPIEWAILEMGDYVIAGDVNIVVERKEAKDFISSLSTERLFVYYCARLFSFPGQCQFTRSSLQAIAILAAPWAR